MPKKLKVKDVTDYVEKNIGTFHEKRLHSLDGLSLRKVLNRKNPYLFKAKNVLTSEQIIKGILDAQISSSEETIFGDWLEGLAIFINQKVFDGRKSGIPGIDLEFDSDNIRYIVTIKSGPNWGNASQIEKMRSLFKTAAKTIRTSNSQIQVSAVNGCCYGRDRNSDKGDYQKLCGQRFWEFISGSPTLYVEIIEPLGHRSKEKNDVFLDSYAQAINKFTKEFSSQFCKDNGTIDWKRIIEFNSSA